MDTRTGKLKKSLKDSEMDQNHQCRYCKKKFHKISTITAHLCPKKQRHLEIDTANSRFAFMAFCRFFELTTNSKKTKTIDEFIDSTYYIDFLKFGNYIVDIKPVNTSQFIDFVVLSGIKLKDWAQDTVYDIYIEDLIKKEPDDSAVERSILTIEEWCKKHNIEIPNFFNNISPNEASFLIRYGKISPWVLYLSSSGENLMTRLNEDHVRLIEKIIDPVFWHKKFKNKVDDVDYVSNLLKMGGL